MVKLINILASNHCVPGIRTPLVADDDIVLGSEQIDQFPFGFISPLESDYASCWHRFSLRSGTEKGKRIDVTSLGRQGSPSAPFAARFTDPMAPAALEFGSYFNEGSSADRAAWQVEGCRGF